MQLAQVNVAEAVVPLSSPRLRGFIQLLDRIDELARRSPGLVWRPRPAEVTAADVALFGWNCCAAPDRRRRRSVCGGYSRHSRPGEATCPPRFCRPARG